MSPQCVLPEVQQKTLRWAACAGCLLAGSPRPQTYQLNDPAHRQPWPCTLMQVFWENRLRGHSHLARMLWNCTASQTRNITCSSNIATSPHNVGPVLHASRSTLIHLKSPTWNCYWHDDHAAKQSDNTSHIVWVRFWSLVANA